MGPGRGIADLSFSYPQRVPRPAGSRPGEAAPWAGLPASRLAGIGLRRVREVVTPLGPEVPWPEAEMIPGVRRSSAVLVALFEEAGEARVILTRRASTLRSHNGEVSFPGGRVDENESPPTAALREANEEIGLDPNVVEIAGALSALRTISSPSSITPFVGLLAARPALVANPAEVEVVFDVALADLLVDGVFLEERWDIPNGPPDRPIYFFDLVSDLVWGATARILSELLVAVTGTGSRPDASP